MTQPEKSLTFPVIFQLILVVLVAPFIPLLVSGQWNWWQAWAYALVSILSFVISRLIVRRIHPDLIKERARFMQAQDTKPWDKILAPVLGLGSIFVLLVAGLDRTYSWSSPFTWPIHLAALIVLLLGFSFSAWALIENRFFSGTVRIQTERGHHVVDSGPYRMVRHPGYAGALLGYLFVPFLLNSWWAWIPTLMLAGVVILRTALEDKTLQAELTGYQEYVQKTRYRLVPGIW